MHVVSVNAWRADRRHLHSTGQRQCFAFLSPCFFFYLYKNRILKMSDEDKDVDIESDEDEFGIPSPSGSGSGLSKNGNQFQSQADKRAHHNALERKRRDHIKDSFSSLRDAVPALQGEKVSSSRVVCAIPTSDRQAQASRAQILKKAAEYIQFMRRKNSSHQNDIDDLKRQNKVLEEQIRALERAKTTGNFAASNNVLDNNVTHSNREVTYEVPSDSDSSDMDDDDDEEDVETTNSRKKLKTSPDVTPVRI